MNGFCHVLQRQPPGRLISITAAGGVPQPRPVAGTFGPQRPPRSRLAGPHSPAKAVRGETPPSGLRGRRAWLGLLFALRQ